VTSTVIIAGITLLMKLNVNVNPIGDVGMSLISSYLQYNTILNELRVARCGLSVKSKIIVLYCMCV